MYKVNAKHNAKMKPFVSKQIIITYFYIVFYKCFKLYILYILIFPKCIKY